MAAKEVIFIEIAGAGPAVGSALIGSANVGTIHNNFKISLENYLHVL